MNTPDGLARNYFLRSQPLRVWERVDPAKDFSRFVEFGSERTRAAKVASLQMVCLLFGIVRADRA